MYLTSLIVGLIAVLLHSSIATALEHSPACCHQSRQNRLSGLDQLIRHEMPASVRDYWMQYTTTALMDASSPCPFIPFATAIVNHTDFSSRGDLICTGINPGSASGNPILHGEIAAINNCTTILQDPNGRFNLTPSETKAAFEDFTLYTNAESCPMCAAAIRWAGFKEYVYGTSIQTLTTFGWEQIQISSLEVFNRSCDLGTPLPLTIAEVNPKVTDPLFRWQFDSSVSCPAGCSRSHDGSTCEGMKVLK